jgi:toxin ParE1/3/4
LRSNLSLTARAVSDIQTIWDYSVIQWGEQTAGKYLDELEAGLNRLKSQPNLLREQPDFHSALRFYRVNKHLLVCDVQNSSVVVLTLIHASMDVPSKLADLEPTLAAEVELLHRQFRDSHPRTS